MSASSKSPVVSIVIVNYRAYPELRACIESLVRFVATDLEVIVVDHSSDRQEAARIARDFRWVRVIVVDRNPGFAAGVNHAARLASGKYLLLMNPDCLVDDDVAHTLATWLDAHPDVGACGARVREADGSLQASARRFPDFTTGLAGRTTWLTRLWPENPWTQRNLTARDARTPTRVDWVSGACTMIRREAFDAVGGMDEGFFLYWEDADLCIRLKERGWSTVYHPGAGVTHLTGRSSAHARRQSLVAFHRSAFRYFYKHARPGARLVAPLVYVALQARLCLKLAGLQLTPRR